MDATRRWDVFVAYASPRPGQGPAAVPGAVRRGLSVCFDKAVLRPGDNWHRELPRHLRSSAEVVALVSSHTANATYETDEVLRALEQKA